MLKAKSCLLLIWVEAIIFGKLQQIPPAKRQYKTLELQLDLIYTFFHLQSRGIPNNPQKFAKFLNTSSIPP